MEAVFKSVGQALHVSFLMEVLPCLTSSSTAWTPRRTDDHGLSRLELRGQCALVRAAVQDHLPEPEKMVVWARYGHLRTRADGLLGVSAYLEGVSKLRSEAARLSVLRSMFEKSRSLSLRAIEKETGVPRSTLHEARLVLREHAATLEAAAEERLSALFGRTALVGA